MSRLRDRNTSDLLVLLVAATVCFMVMAIATAVVIIEIVHPETDTSGATRQIAGIVNTLIGLLAGFLAGRSGKALDAEHKEPTKGPEREKIP